MKKIILYGLVCLLLKSGSAYSQVLSLNDLIRLGVQNNLELKSKYAEKNREEALFYDVIMPENPELFLELDGVPKKSSYKNWGERKIGVKQKLKFPLHYYQKGKLHNLKIKKLQANLEILEIELIKNISLLYYKALTLKEKEFYLNEMNEITKSIYEKAKIKLEVGETTSYDVLRAKVDVSEIKNMLFANKKEYINTTSRLKLLVGFNKNYQLQLNDVINYNPSDNFLMKKNFYEGNNPLIKYHNLEKEISQKEYSLEWYSLIPEFEFSYFQKKIREEISPRKIWGFEIGLSIPLWFPLKNRATIKSASYNVDAISFHNKLKHLQVEREIDEAYNNLKVADELVKNFNQILDEAEELLRISKRSYEEGEMDYFKLSDALKTTYQTRTEYLEALYNLKKAEAELKSKLGIINL